MCFLCGLFIYLSTSKHKNLKDRDLTLVGYYTFFHHNPVDIHPWPRMMKHSCCTCSITASSDPHQSSLYFHWPLFSVTLLPQHWRCKTTWHGTYTKLNISFSVCVCMNVHREGRGGGQVQTKFLLYFNMTKYSDKKNNQQRQNTV